MLATRSGRLEKIGQVGGLGRGERIYAVRFIEDRGYVVTFRQTDPLYTLDLADPAHPRVRGELKILGYSAYLHPVGEHELLGIGQDATPEGCARARSSRCSTSPTPPRRSCCSTGRARRARRPPRREYDHHAFLWWAPTRLAVVPVSRLRRAGGRRRRSASASTARRGHRRGRAHRARTADVLRTLVVAERLFTLTDEGLHAYDLDTLAPGPFAAFRSN